MQHEEPLVTVDHHRYLLCHPTHHPGQPGDQRHGGQRCGEGDLDGVPAAAMQRYSVVSQID